MRIVFFTDGSDDGLDAVRPMFRLIDPAEVSELFLVAVTWPQRSSPIWDKAYDLHVFAHDDLHAGMALAASRVLQRFRSYVSEVVQDIHEVTLLGEPAHELLAFVEKIQPDFVLAAVTGGSHRDVVATRLAEVSRRACCPVAIIHAPSVDAPSLDAVRGEATVG